MKSRIPLSDFLPHLPAQLQDGIDAAMKDAACPGELHRAVAVSELAEGGERTFVGYASTRSVDRDGEVLLPQGIELSQFRKAPVLLWGHKWSEPPVGRDTHIENDGFGIKTRSELADTALANDLWKLIKAKMLKTSSIGYIPLAYVTPQSKDWGGMMDTMKGWPEWDMKSEPQAVVTRAVLLEHSLVSVPANIDALIVSVKELGLSELAKTLKPERSACSGGMIHDIFVAPVAPKAFVPITFPPRLVKTAEQVRLEWEAEMARLIADEISRRMGRV